MGRSRQKPCDHCGQISSVLYRVKHDGGDWGFVCPGCWSAVSANNPLYVYGGTWKANKRT